MRYPDEHDDGRVSAPVTYTIITVSALVLIILVFVLISNNQKPRVRNTAVQADKATPSPVEEVMEFAEGQEDIETLYRENKLRSEDLDFWDMYQQKDVVVETTPSPKPTPSSSPELTDEEKAKDGKHILVSYKDGTQE